MIRLPNAKGKTYGIVGLRASGQATLAAMNISGAKVELWDDREEARTALQKQHPTLEFRPPIEWKWKNIHALVMSPGVPLYHPTVHPAVVLAQKHGVPVLGDIALLQQAQPEARYIGVTGTNGKSTTTTLIAHILKQCGVPMQVGGNLGPPALQLEPMGDGTYVLEVSSYQLDLMPDARFTTAILLNITPDHIDHHGTMEAYIKAKKHIFNNQQKKDVAIIGVDDAHCDTIAKELCANRKQCVLPISVKKPLASGVYVQNAMLHNTFALVEEKGDLRLIKSLQGEHNWQNAAAAYAACFAHGVPHKHIIDAMKTYPGLPHRMQWLGEYQGVQFVNDSKGTNADATEKALKTYDNMYWIAGGVAKEGGIETLAPYFAKIRHAYLIGEAAPSFAKTLTGKVDVVQCGTLEKAFHAAADAAAQEKIKGAAVLLSPASASFDQFENFEKRGEAFVALYDAMRKKGAA